MKWEHLEEIAEALGITPTEAEALLRRGFAAQRQAAWEAMDADGLPPDIIAFAQLAEAATGQRVTAVRPCYDTTWEPAFPPKNRLDWSVRRAYGQLRPSDPPAVEKRREGYELVTDGNPVLIQEWAQEHGFYASAGSPWTCFIQWEIKK